ncbi:hypothetical protein BJ508DRAFT_314557 [Ascobolus immersus RN42]|uniref:Uncharacterized protein n=1 Tax=Ascobolus immersus RN42 TaxID=1160509 RepID=A0A3N4HEK8_ASCIM|nr:hypothetical protein BJ508DRAFT_314557 [Ascobolus immersus RN42]
MYACTVTTLSKILDTTNLGSTYLVHAICSATRAQGHPKTAKKFGPGYPRLSFQPAPTVKGPLPRAEWASLGVKAFERLGSDTGTTLTEIHRDNSSGRGLLSSPDYLATIPDRWKAGSSLLLAVTRMSHDNIWASWASWPAGRHVLPTPPKVRNMYTCNTLSLIIFFIVGGSHVCKRVYAPEGRSTPHCSKSHGNSFMVGRLRDAGSKRYITTISRKCELRLSIFGISV